jgi:hypothetical protein
VREAQEVERLRFSQATACSSRGGEPPGLDQPRLARVQFQPELREPAAQLVQEPLSVLLILEPDDEVVREPHDNDLAVRVALPPPIGPQVKDVVQVHVREQRRRRCP